MVLSKKKPFHFLILEMYVLLALSLHCHIFYFHFKIQRLTVLPNNIYLKIVNTHKFTHSLI